MSYISGRMCSLAVQTLCAKSPSLVFVGLKIAKQMNLARPCTLISLHSRFSTVQGIQSNISSLQLKKRLTRKKLLSEDQTTVVAFSTAEEYDLERLVEGLKVQDLYETKNVDNSPDVVHAVAKYEVGHQVRDIFFFREGSIVLWNVSELESSNLLNFLRTFQQDGYAEKIVHAEAEVMSFAYLENGKSSSIQGDQFCLSFSPDEDLTLDKYTFSNAMALSVKLGVWEASLNNYIDSIEYVTEDLKKGQKIRMSREEVLRKHGELFALRHLINLSSDLLDTPDFYWDRERLETLYLQTCAYFSISRRTKVMNEKINHCVELIELLSSHLSDKHHIRLEWMIIVLIMVEVGFETLHYLERYAT